MPSDSPHNGAHADFYLAWRIRQAIVAYAKAKSLVAADIPPNTAIPIDPSAFARPCFSTRYKVGMTFAWAAVLAWWLAIVGLWGAVL